eukprot:3987797-Amphidinium_carterae.1
MIAASSSLQQHWLQMLQDVCQHQDSSVEWALHLQIEMGKMQRALSLSLSRMDTTCCAVQCVIVVCVWDMVVNMMDFWRTTTKLLFHANPGARAQGTDSSPDAALVTTRNRSIASERTQKWQQCMPCFRTIMHKGIFLFTWPLVWHAASTPGVLDLLVLRTVEVYPTRVVRCHCRCGVDCLAKGITALVSDLASLVGCTVGLPVYPHIENRKSWCSMPDEVTAITLVALGEAAQVHA